VHDDQKLFKMLILEGPGGLELVHHLNAAKAIAKPSTTRPGQSARMTDAQLERVLAAADVIRTA